jgi:hypothetical protein
MILQFLLSASICTFYGSLPKDVPEMFNNVPGVEP